jgi:hypothetical protein
MKLAGSGTCLLTSALLVAAAAWSQDTTANSTATTTTTTSSAAADSPYATIVARNMFGLVPIPPPDPDAGKPPVEPPPKITPNGIMTIFGKDQALFKVANKPKPGQPAKDDSYVLAEGERQDDITVVKINHVDGIITFDNHGTTQELALVPAKESGPGGGPGGPGAGNRGGAFGQPNPAGQPTGGGVRPFPGRVPGSNPSAGINNNNNNSSIGNPNAALGIGGGAAGIGANGGITMLGDTPVNANRVYQPAADSEITPEQSAILIEAQRMKALQSGNKRLASMLPPTPLTPSLQEPEPGAGDVPQ